MAGCRRDAAPPPTASQPPYGSYPPNQYGAPPYGGFGAPDHPQATTVLILGILGLVLCQLISPFAWVMGNRVVAEIDASNGQLGGRSTANAGRICGIVGTVARSGWALLIAVRPSIIVLIAAAQRPEPATTAGGAFRRLEQDVEPRAQLVERRPSRTGRAAGSRPAADAAGRAPAAGPVTGPAPLPVTHSTSVARQPPDVGGGRDRAAGVLLGRGVPVGAHPALDPAGAGGQAEVDEDRATLLDDDVVRLHVEVHPAVPVQVAEHGDQLAAEQRGVRDAEPTVVDERGEGGARQRLQHEGRAAAR